MKKNLLVIGLDIASIASSAKRSGYNVYGVDYFGDIDTRAATQVSYSLIDQASNRSCGHISEIFSPSSLVELAQKISHQYPLDGILLASGFEDYPEELKALSELAPILGNPIDVIARVRDRTHFFETLASKGIPFPRTIKAKGLKQLEKAASELGYPLVVKPAKGFGGEGIRLVRNTRELDSVGLSDNEMIVQEYIKGVSASASILGTGSESIVLALNKQLIGIRQLGAPTCFTYCGNITPLKAPPTTLKLCKLICSEVSNTFGLVGSNGVDFVLDSSGKPWILEVNPRFQATIECVEKMLGINLVEAHIAACEGSLITPPSVSQGYFTRVILYAKRRCSVPDLSILYGVRDIPIPGVIVEKGEPVCSVFTTGQTETESIDKAIKCTRQIYRLLCVEKTAVS